MEYLELNGVNKEYQFSKDKDDYLEKIDQFFPEASFLKKLNEIRNEFQRRRLLSEKFNGEMVMKITGLEGKDLGIFLNNFKSSKSNWYEYLENTPVYMIQSDVLNFGK